MIAQITDGPRTFQVDLSDPIDISIPLVSGENRLSAWSVSPITIEPVRTNGFIGSVEEGGDVNFRNIAFNPHGHGTHTECVGHISKEVISVNQTLKRFHMIAQVLSIEPTQIGEDLVITVDQLPSELDCNALCIRTMPNEDSKLTRLYSDANPPYIDQEAMRKIVELGVEHLLIDTPSVDREQDEGELISHHIFWDYPAEINRTKTITELIYIPTEIQDGEYFMELQFAPFENDASPSRPVLYRIQD